MGKKRILYLRVCHIHNFSDPCRDEDVWGGVDAVLYMLASDHVLEAKEDELRKFLKLLFYYPG